MPRNCTICTHDEAHSVNVALVQRDPYRKIAEEFGLSEAALSRHARKHLPKLLLRAKDAVEVADADSLLSRIEGLYKRTEAILEAAERSREWGRPRWRPSGSVGATSSCWAGSPRSWRARRL